MKQGNLLKLLGLAVAGLLVAFGGLSNFWRTVKFNWERIYRD